MLGNSNSLEPVKAGKGLTIDENGSIAMQYPPVEVNLNPSSKKASYSRYSLSSSTVEAWVILNDVPYKDRTVTIPVSQGDKLEIGYTCNITIMETSSSYKSTAQVKAYFNGTQCASAGVAD